MRIARPFLRIAVPALLTAAWFAGCSSKDSGVTPPPSQTVSSVTLSAASTTPIASLGETVALTAVAKNASGATIASPVLTYTSSAPAVATVSGTGTTAAVTSVGNGTATITASGGTAQATVQVTVAQLMTSVAVSGAPASLAPGATAQLTAEARDARQRPVAGVTGFTFASSDLSVAVVTPTGLVTAIAPGTVSLTSVVTQSGVTSNGAASLAVAFAAAQPSTATVDATNQNVFTPSTVTVAAGGTVTWSIASVTHNVTFRAVTGAPTNISNTASSAASRTFATAGTFPYDCTIHSGMTGTVVVQAAAGSTSFTALLNGANERPTPATTLANGAASFSLSGTTVSYVITFSRLTSAPAAAHIHGPGSAAQVVGVVVPFSTAGQTGTAGVLRGTFTAADIRGLAGQPAFSLDSLLTLMRNGNAYVNVHTAMFPGGEIRGQTGPR